MEARHLAVPGAKDRKTRLEGVPLTTGQWIYIGILCLYVGMFALFLRLFYWKHYADKTCWSKRPDLSLESLQRLAASEGSPFPMISIFVPAREETAVIGRTIEHLSRLEYPAGRFEIIVVTDEKEIIKNQEDREQHTTAALHCLTGQAEWPTDPRAESLLLGLFTRLALAEWTGLPSAKTPPGAEALLNLPPELQRQALLEFATEMWSQKARPDRKRLMVSLRRVVRGGTNEQLEMLYAACLTLSMPALLLAAQLRHLPGNDYLARITLVAARSRHSLSQKVIMGLSHTVSQHVAQRLQRLEQKGRLAATLDAIWTETQPTTPDIVDRKALQYAHTPGLPPLKHVTVPYDFDGNVNGVCTGRLVPSTKGRALNYAFAFASANSEMWAFYDAESRPDRKTLLYVAWRRLTAGTGFQLAQGPVYQIRNFWQSGPLCKIAGLYQSVAHKWIMPYLLKTIPFIGGTNIFASRELMLKIKGFDHHVLTEDMDLGARAWLQGNVWPEFLPYASSEQTPPTFKAFFRQRLRWGSGYLQVYEKLRNDHTLNSARKEHLLRRYFWMGHMQWIGYQLLALLPLFIPALALMDLLDSSAVPVALRWSMSSLSVVYFAFTFYVLWHFYDHVDRPADRPRFTRFTGTAQLLTLPITALLLPTPYSSAMVLHWLGWQPKSWVKTPRTQDS